MFSKALKSSNFYHLGSKEHDNVNGTRHFFLIWCIIAIILCLIEASTLDVLPSLMQDEAQITDYGRLALDPLSRWSVTWWVAGDKPLLLWSYLGPLIAELGYQLGGLSGVGTRIAALIGGLVASAVAFSWLIQRKVPQMFAGLLSLAFLLDPLFTLSQRMARTDSWVMAFCLASCWLLRLSSSKDKKTRILLVMLAGAFAAIAAFVWPSALFLFPLICTEFISSFYNGNFDKKSLQKLAKMFSYFVLAGLFASVLLLVPIQHQLDTIFDDMRNMVALNVNASKTPLDRIVGVVSPQPWAKLIKAFIKTLSPFFPLLALWAILFKRERGIVLAAAFTLVIIFTTLVYEFRLLYLLPYFLILAANLFQRTALPQLNPIVQRLSTVFLVILVIWSFGVSVFVRSAFAYNDGDQRKRNLIDEAAQAAIGTGNYRVFLAFTYEFYFTGRALGWQMYTPYIQFSFDDQGNWIRKDDFEPKTHFMKLLAKMDYAIFPGNLMTEDLRSQLSTSGLEYRGPIHIGMQQDHSSAPESGRSMDDIFTWYLQGAPSYGPYMLFARADSDATSPKLTLHTRKSQ
jgi:4-amino-4-deoxy-L-arabinose transferase-like glycosyltransferase